MGTAHACKFEETMRVALGDDFWNEEFMTEHMPASAKGLGEKPEFRKGVFKSLPLNPTP